MGEFIGYAVFGVDDDYTVRHVMRRTPREVAEMMAEWMALKPRPGETWAELKDRIDGAYETGGWKGLDVRLVRRASAGGVESEPVSFAPGFTVRDALPVALSYRELSTVLAALRYWQREGWSSDGHEHGTASDDGEIEPLAPFEIDDLCERING